MLTIATILDIVHVVASFFAQKTHGLSTSNVELLLAACLVALHARTNSCSASLALIFANVTSLHTKRANCERPDIIIGPFDILTLLYLSAGICSRTIGSIVETLPKRTSGMYSAQMTCAHPLLSVLLRAPSRLGHNSHLCTEKRILADLTQKSD